MGEDVLLKELVSSLRDCDVSAVLERAKSHILQGGGGKRAHSYICSALLREDGVRGNRKACSDFLRCIGAVQALCVIYSNIARASRSTAHWLAGEVRALLDHDTLSSILYNETCSQSSSLSPDQEQLLAALTRLPDLLANQLGHSLPPSLLPPSLFPCLGTALLECLNKLHTDLKDGRDRSLAFPEAVLSKIAILGHAEAVLSQLVPTLQVRSCNDPLWGRVCRSLFCRVSNSALDAILTALVQLLTPSLVVPHPLYQLLGDLVLTNQRAQLILTHKLWLSRLPSNQSAVYSLIGYLLSWQEGRVLLGKSLQSALGVWSDSGCVRRMEGRHHLWLCQLLVLGTSCLSQHPALLASSGLRAGVMRGLQVHLESVMPGVRERGLAVGQCLMNSLHSMSKEKQLHFDLRESSDVDSILKLSRPLSQQQLELEASSAQCAEERGGGEEGDVGGVKGEEGERGGGKEGEGTSFSAGMVLATEASNSDSDDDLEPFDMSHDPDHTHSASPRYLRDCIDTLVSHTDREAVEATLSALPTLILSRPPDLSEVAVELARALLHLQDNWDTPSFSSLRHTALVALTTTKPHLLAPFLTKEFYSPNHNLRQRLDVLEVISSAATELSTPSPPTPSQPTPSPPTPSHLTASQTKKPWQQLIDERVRAKTRIISKGPQKPPLPVTPSRFAPVATLFFFPLMASYDRVIPTLDLLGRDCLLLGHLVRTLGNVVWCSCHCPAEPAMARALLEFLWALRYHPSSFVRQAVLCAFNMTVVATPTNYLLLDLHEAIEETMLWVEDVYREDADEEVRSLAGHTHSLLSALAQQQQRIFI